MKRFFVSVALGVLVLLLAIPAWAVNNTLVKSDNMITYTSNGGTNDISLADNNLSKL